MNELNNEVEINASAERVWHLLTDFAQFPKWNPFIQRVRGEPTPGGTAQCDHPAIWDTCYDHSTNRAEG